MKIQTDICLTIVASAFSYAVFENEKVVRLKHIYKAIMNCQSVYSDVVRKESENFKEQFKEFIEKENIDLNDY